MALAAASTAALVGCMSTIPSGSLDSAVSAKSPLSQPPWTYGCDLSPKDSFGEKKRRYCFLMVNDAGGEGAIIGNSARITFETMIEVDERGPRLLGPQKQSSCRDSPRKIAIDGQRIDGISREKQIDAMLTGTLLTIEKQTEWPYCGIVPYATYLTGVRSAYDAMMTEWANANPPQ